MVNVVPAIVARVFGVVHAVPMRGSGDLRRCATEAGDQRVECAAVRGGPVVRYSV